MGTVQPADDGYLVHFGDGSERRTYGCVGKRALGHLVQKLTGRSIRTFVTHADGAIRAETDDGFLSVIPNFHIYEVV